MKNCPFQKCLADLITKYWEKNYDEALKEGRVVFTGLLTVLEMATQY